MSSFQAWRERNPIGHHMEIRRLRAAVDFWVAETSSPTRTRTPGRRTRILELPDEQRPSDRRFTSPDIVPRSRAGVLGADREAGRRRGGRTPVRVVDVGNFLGALPRVCSNRDPVCCEGPRPPDRGAVMFARVTVVQGSPENIEQGRRGLNSQAASGQGCRRLQGRVPPRGSQLGKGNRHHHVGRRGR